MHFFFGTLRVYSFGMLGNFGCYCICHLQIFIFDFCSLLDYLIFSTQPIFSPLVKSSYQTNNFLISLPKQTRDSSFEHQKQMLKIMNKKIFYNFTLKFIVYLNLCKKFAYLDQSYFASYGNSAH